MSTKSKKEEVVATFRNSLDDAQSIIVAREATTIKERWGTTQNEKKNIIPLNLITEDTAKKIVTDCKCS